MTNKNPIFVIHQHSAKNKHFDLRLEINSVLKSWAVPKGIPQRGKAKRLAIQVEDHDMSYAKFSGEISAGQHGAGKVEIWDTGVFELMMNTSKTIQVLFAGKKLKGVYVLKKFTKAGDKAWLLFRGQDKRSEEHSAGVIIVSDDFKKFLIVQSSQWSYWGFPKGNIDKGETPKQTVIREVDEEVGVEKLKFIPKFKESVTWKYQREGKLIDKDTIYYLASTKTKEIEKSWEIKNTKWLSFSKALAQLDHENDKKLLLKAKKHLTSIAK
ncbi:MAG: DNA polymerase ligase N-terminal domain-containing protein [bacterium]